LYVYPALSEDGKLLDTHNIAVDDEIKILYEYLIKSDKIVDLKNVKKERLHISSKEVLDKIRKGDASWVEMVPKYISDYILREKLFV